MAGGMVVLGGIALAPLAVVGMFFGTNSGKQKLNAAKDYQDEVEVLREKIKTLIFELTQIRRGASLLSGSIKALDSVMQIQVSKMDAIATRLNNRPFLQMYIVDPIKKIFDMSVLTDEEAQVLLDSVNCAAMLRQLLEKPLMNEEGAFLSDALEFLESNKKQIDGICSNTGTSQISMYGRHAA